MTCWTLIQAARGGDRPAKRRFAERYLPVVKAYLAKRWEGSPLIGELDDGVQEVFLACFKRGGALESLERGRGGGFRAYLFGVARNTALHFETRRAREFRRRGSSSFDPGGIVARDSALSRVFDREWARAVLREAAELQAEQAREKGAEAVRRVELLKLRFDVGKPVREIARLWSVDAAKLHHSYSLARKEFLAALREVVGLHESCSREELRAKCEWIQSLLE